MSVNPTLALLPAIIFIGVFISVKVNLVTLDAFLVFSTPIVIWFGVRFDSFGIEISTPKLVIALIMIAGIFGVVFVSTMIAFSTGAEFMSNEKAFLRREGSIALIMFDVIAITCITTLAKLFVKRTS